MSNLEDMAALRLRVMASLARKGSEAPTPVTDMDSDLEDGEVQEAVDTLIAKNSLSFPDSSKTVHYSAAPTVWNEPFEHGIPGLNGSRTNGFLTNDKRKPRIGVIEMPQDTPIYMEPKLSNSETVRSDTTSHTVPGSSTLRASNGKRQVSADFPVKARTKRRLGTNRHKSLVIDLETDDEEDAKGRAFETSKSLHDHHSTAKLRKVEADIAQAMAIINKAQEMQNAKKLNDSSPNNEITIAASDSITSASSRLNSDAQGKAILSHTGSDGELVRKAAESHQKLTQLQALLTRSDVAIAEKRKVLLSMKIANAELSKNDEIESIRAQNYMEMIATTGEEVKRLQDDLAALQREMQDAQSKQAGIRGRLADAMRLQTSTQEEIKQLESKRRELVPEISALKASISYSTTISPTWKRHSPADVQKPESSMESVTSSIPGITAAFVQQSSGKLSVDGVPEIPTSENKRLTDTKEARLEVDETRSLASTQSPVLLQSPLEGYRSASRSDSSAISKIPTTKTMKRDMDISTATSMPTSPHDERKPTSTSSTSASVNLMDRGDNPHQTSLTDPNHFERDVAKTQALPCVATRAGFPPRLDPSCKVYISPLSRFRSFKYNPGYLFLAKSGFRSSTYFHRAKENVELCKYETQGGKCNATDCASQHFSEILMTGPPPCD